MSEPFNAPKGTVRAGLAILFAYSYCLSAVCGNTIAVQALEKPTFIILTFYFVAKYLKTGEDRNVNN